MTPEESSLSTPPHTHTTLLHSKPWDPRLVSLGQQFNYEKGNSDSTPQVLLGVSPEPIWGAGVTKAD